MLRASDGVQIGLVSLVPSNCENSGGTISTFTSVARNLGWIRHILTGDGESRSTTLRPGHSESTTRKPATLFGINLDSFSNFFNKRQS